MFLHRLDCQHLPVSFLATEYVGHEKFGQSERFLNAQWPKMNSKSNVHWLWGGSVSACHAVLCNFTVASWGQMQQWPWLLVINSLQDLMIFSSQFKLENPTAWYIIKVCDDAFFFFLIYWLKKSDILTIEFPIVISYQLSCFHPCTVKHVFLFLHIKIIYLLIYLLCVCVWVHKCTIMCVGQRTTSWSLFSPAMWVLSWGLNSDQQPWQ